MAEWLALPTLDHEVPGSNFCVCVGGLGGGGVGGGMEWNSAHDCTALHCM